MGLVSARVEWARPARLAHRKTNHNMEHSFEKTRILFEINLKPEKAMHRPHVGLVVSSSFFVPPPIYGRCHCGNFPFRLNRSPSWTPGTRLPPPFSPTTHPKPTFPSSQHAFSVISDHHAMSTQRDHERDHSATHFGPLESGRFTGRSAGRLPCHQWIPCNFNTIWIQFSASNGPKCVQAHLAGRDPATLDFELLSEHLSMTTPELNKALSTISDHHAKMTLLNPRDPSTLRFGPSKPEMDAELQNANSVLSGHYANLQRLDNLRDSSDLDVGQSMASLPQDLRDAYQVREFFFDEKCIFLVSQRQHIISQWSMKFTLTPLLCANEEMHTSISDKEFLQ